MGSILTKENFNTLNDLQSSNEKSFRVPIFKENDVDLSDTKFATITINNLLNEVEYKINPHEYTKSVEILQFAAICGCPRSAAKLGHISLRGLDYASSVAYYFIALKFIKMNSNTKRDLNLILEVVEGLTESYRFHLNRQRDLLIWNHGVKMMKFMDDTLKDPFFLKTLSNKEVQKSKALRIHIAFCLALTAESESNNTGNYKEAVRLYRECEQIGQCGLTFADKLVKKAHTKFRLLESRVPRVQPICETCNFEAKDLKAIWNLLVCPKCQIVACCSRECLKHHLSLH